MKKLFIAILTVAMMTTAMHSLNQTSFITEVEAAVKMNKTKATIVKGKTLTLKVLGTKKKVTWSSSNKNVATVSSKGKVTAKRKGTCTITAKVAGKKYTCKITVKNPTTKLNKTSLAMQVGDTYTLKPTSDGASKTVKWKTSNNSIVSVSTKGKVTAKKIGTAKITATMNGVSKTITVKLKTCCAVTCRLYKCN